MIYDGLTLDTPPATDFVTDADLYEHLRVETSGSPAAPEDATIIGAYKRAAMAHLDGAYGVLGRALVSQTWTVEYRAFPARPDPVLGSYALWLPLPPLQSVSSVAYTDTDGSAQTLASSKYDVVKRGDRPGYLVPAYGESWPSTRDEPSAVRVTFVAGYGESAADVPDSITTAALLLAAELYEHRSARDAQQARMYSNPTVEALLAPYRVFGWGRGL